MIHSTGCSTEQEEHITTIASQLDKAGLAVIAVITLDDCGANKQQFRQELFNSWNIGHIDSNGLLILVCWYDGDKSRRSVEQQYGSGLGEILSSNITDQIAQEKFVPAFQQDHPGKGLVDMVIKYNTLIRKGPVTSKSSSSTSPTTTSTNGEFITIIIIVAILFGLSLKTTGGQSSSDWDNGGRDRDSDRDSFRGRDGGGSDKGGSSSTKF